MIGTGRWRMMMTPLHILWLGGALTKVNIEEATDETREGEINEQTLRGTRKGTTVIANGPLVAAKRGAEKK